MTRQEITYYPDSYDIKTYREYHNASLAISQEYDKNGNLTQQKTTSTEENTTYNNKGQHHGPATCYLNGIMYYDLNYHKGKRHLAQKHYYEDGTLFVEEYFLYGKLFGLKKRYHSNGSIKHIENYSDNKLHGERMVFNEDGKLVVHSTYKRGSIIKSHPINITT